MLTYEIRTLKAAPSMNETIREFTGTYAAACDEARNEFAATGRRSAVVRGMFYYFTIRTDGETDRNVVAS